MSDRIFGGIGLLIAILFAWQATLIQESFMSDAVGPKTFPIIIAVVMALSSLYFIIKPDAEPHWPQVRPFIEVSMAVLILCAYALALPEFGFGVSTAVAAAYLAWRLNAVWWQALLAGVLTAAGLFLIFRIILGLSLARGPLGF